MWEALRVAGADGFVRAHDDGLQMRVAQGGINFSGGQRQRLAIARAVIRRPTIYLFDDAFSALDVHTEARVRAALREISADCHDYRCHAAGFDCRRGRSSDRHRCRETGRCGHARIAAGGLPHLRRIRRLAIVERRGTGDSDHATTATGGRCLAHRDFTRSAVRLVKRLAPQRRLVAAVIDARNHRNRNRSRRSADPGSCDRSAVQRRDRARAARRESPSSRPSPRPGATATTRSPTCCRG